MSTSSRRLSAKAKTSKNSHTPGKDKGAYCVRRTDANLAVSTNPYKGQGLKGQAKSAYNRFWSVMLPLNGVKHVEHT